VGRGGGGILSVGVVGICSGARIYHCLVAIHATYAVAIATMLQQVRGEVLGGGGPAEVVLVMLGVDE
jgi:xanthosine utilization system XapX-like protein